MQFSGMMEKIEEMEREAQIAINEEKIKEQQTQVKYKKEDFDESWMAKEGLIHKAYVASLACSHTICDVCGIGLSDTVRCTDCMKHLCSQCDTTIHIANPFHNRKWFRGELSTRILLPEEFLNFQGNLVTIRKWPYCPYSTKVFSLEYLHVYSFIFTFK